jgi:NhaA family Na+:H+ antiporter
MPRRTTLEFLKTEAASGVILAGAALLAIILANSRWSHAYFGFIHTPLTVQIGAFAETLPLLDWVKHGLMAIFFFVVGMEIKFEVLKGELNNPRRLALPILGAVGGMAVPALIYLAASAGRPVAHGAWAVPTATDIAFALTALALVAKRLPGSLRIFLLTLAIVDDLGAVGLISVLFTHDVQWWALAGAGIALAVMALLGLWRSAPFLFYALGFVLVWAFTLKSGVSTSVAGVLAAFTIPVGARRRGQDSVLRHFMDSLHPYVAFGVLPLFAFVAAGFSLQGLSLQHLLEPATLGVVLGLFVGKQVGVFGFAALAVILGFGRKPTAATWLELYGVSILCGVGFTMSLFISGLVFPDTDLAAQTQMRLGVTLASALSTVMGVAVLGWAGGLRAARDAPPPPTA